MGNEITNARVIRKDILVDPQLNSRKTIDVGKVNKLRDSIKAQGLIHPCLLIRTAQLGKKYESDGHPYVLVAGFRRQNALDMLGEDQGLKEGEREADYRVAPIEWKIEDALMANLTENLSREDLSTYELAAQCAELHNSYKLTGKEIATRVRAHDSEAGNRKALSEAHVNNLIRCATTLHPSIIEAWKEQHPKASLRTLIALAAERDQDAQLRQWQGVEEGPEEGEGGESGSEGGGEKNEKEKPVRRPSPIQLTIMCEKIKDAAKAEKKSEEWAKGAILALRWAGGVVANIPGIKLDE
jgi:ParB/RepB/Spo0J family partition protein